MIYVVDQSQLAQAASRIAKAPRLAVDTEADSLHHYHEKLCLLQISTPAEDYVIDPLVPLDLQELLKKIEPVPLILHGADFDLRILKRFYRFEPREIFDTMIAAQFLGYSRPSLAALAEKHCGVHLAKSNQKADWSRRPLKESMLVYASNDTHYLHAIARVLEGELRERGRMSWLTDTCREVLKSTGKKEPPDPKTAWRVKGSHALEGRELLLLRELWQWREDQAKKKDYPPFKVLHSEVLVAVSRWAHANPNKPVATMPKFPHYLKPPMVESMEKTVKRALKLREDVRLPVSRKGSKRLSRKEERRLSALKGARVVLAQEYNCQPGVLVSNAVLENLATQHLKSLEDIQSLNCLMPWQFDIVAKRFLEVLREIDARGHG